MTTFSRRQILAGAAVSAIAVAAPVAPFTPVAVNVAGESIFAGDLLMQVGGRLYRATTSGMRLVGVSSATCSIGSPVPIWEMPA